MKMFVVKSEGPVQKPNSPFYGMTLPYITKFNGVPLFVTEFDNGNLRLGEPELVPACMVGVSVRGDRFFVGVGEGEVVPIPLFAFDPVADMNEAASALGFILGRISSAEDVDAVVIKDRIRGAAHRSHALADRLPGDILEPQE